MEVGIYTAPTGIALYRGTAWNAARFATTDLMVAAYRRVDVLYNRSATDTWIVKYRGAEVLRYSDPAVERWRENSGPFLGFGARTGASAGTFAIRRVELEATSEPAWAARLAVEELPDD